MIFFKIYSFYFQFLFVVGFLIVFVGKRFFPVLKGNERKWLVVIPAHNEESVIKNLLTDLSSQSCDIVVLGDHCSDSTKFFVESFGVKFLDRQSGSRGKQFSLSDFFTFADLSNYDSVCVLDADNRVDSNFLSSLSPFLNKYQIVQSYLDTSNSIYNWVSGGYAVNYVVMNDVFQKVRSFFGLSALLGGTGFAFNTSLLQSVDFILSTLTDDLELSLLCNLRGFRVGYAYSASVYDEKPFIFKASMVQRSRWIVGSYQVFLKFFIDALRSKNWRIGELWFFVSVYCTSLFSLAYLIFNYGISMTIANLFFTSSIAVAYNFIFLLSRKKFKLLKYSVSAVIISMSSLILLVPSLFKVRNSQWVRTEHFG